MAASRERTATIIADSRLLAASRTAASKVLAASRRAASRFQADIVNAQVHSRYQCISQDLPLQGWGGKRCKIQTRDFSPSREGMIAAMYRLDDFVCVCVFFCFVSGYNFSSCSQGVSWVFSTTDRSTRCDSLNGQQRIVFAQELADSFL